MRLFKQFQKVSRSSKYPLEIVKSNLHVVTLEEHKQIAQYKVLPGQKICKNFAKTIFKSGDADQNDDVERSYDRKFR